MDAAETAAAAPVLSPAQRYASVLGAPDVARLMAAAVLARLPIGIDTLAIVLFVRGQTGSFAVAGLVIGAWAVGSGVVNPFQGRLVDRHFHARVLMPLAVAGTTVLCVIAGAGLAPLLAAVNQVVVEVAPPGAATEAFGWPITAMGLGVACGSAAAGAIVQALGWRPRVRCGGRRRRAGSGDRRAPQDPAAVSFCVAQLGVCQRPPALAQASR